MYRSQLYDIAILRKDYMVTFGMQMHSKVVSTQSLPHTLSFLYQNAPSVLETNCQNNDGLPFTEEVKNTELGHLFEHILLDRLCLQKIQNGKSEAHFKGRTNWDWNTDPYGYFKIHIAIGESDFRFVGPSVLETIELFNKLLRIRQKTPIYKRLLNPFTIA